MNIQKKSIFMLGLLIIVSCRTRAPQPRFGGSPEARQESGDQEKKEQTEKSTEEPVNSDGEINPHFIVESLCSSNDSNRQQAKDLLAQMKLGTSPVTVADLAKSQEDCVLGILPAALYTELKKNIPAAVLVGQAIQETGWCKSELAHKAGNLHGQKASFDAKHFTHWDGESYSHLSSEDPEGQGKNIQRSSFMKFTHFEFSFFSAAERFSLPGSPYTQCLTEKSRDLDFLNCIGKIWAVDQNYAQDVAKHFAFQSKTLGFTLRNCGINH